MSSTPLWRILLCGLVSLDSRRRTSPRRVCIHSTRFMIINHTTLVDGYLGMSNDEERSEMRYVVRIAEFSESSKL